MIQQLKEQLAQRKLSTFESTIGKTVERVDSNKSALIFTDGTYLRLTLDREPGSTDIVPGELSRDTLQKVGFIQTDEQRLALEEARLAELKAMSLEEMPDRDRRILDQEYATAFIEARMKRRQTAA